MENGQQFSDSAGAALPADPSAVSSGPNGVPAEGWYQVDLQGEWEGHPAGAYRLTPADIRCIVEYFNQSCRANGVDLPVDYEHQGVVAKLLGKSAESGGWINSLEGAERRYRALGAHQVGGRRASADPREEIPLPQLAPAEGLQGPGHRPDVRWALDSVALTNRPFKKALPAVANSDAALRDWRGAASPIQPSQNRRTEPCRHLLALLAAAMNEGRAALRRRKAVANSIGVAEDAGRTRW